ncbi:MAG: hypothetical protein M1829_003746 [Trizodia sp. TS-e1964]|nr:MAG: hypothetical protein M1829_003746 [Trizodia sp. TS-e1964]
MTLRLPLELEYMNIPLPKFLYILSKYDELIAQISGAKEPKEGSKDPNLQTLDSHRFIKLPIELRARKAAAADQDERGAKRRKIGKNLTPSTQEGGAFMTKAEVELLIKWKLRHGKFRPSLQKLVASNAPEEVEATTSSAFTKYDRLSRPSTTSLTAAAPIAIINELATLKGIGPATASLILAVYAEADVPFFSDELFRWVSWGDEAKSGAQGWLQNIKYNTKEYTILFKRVVELMERLRNEARLENNGSERSELTAAQVEKVAFVLGHNQGKSFETYWQSTLDTQTELPSTGFSAEAKHQEREADNSLPYLDPQTSLEEKISSSKPAWKRQRKASKNTVSPKQTTPKVTKEGRSDKKEPSPRITHEQDANITLESQKVPAHTIDDRTKLKPRLTKAAASGPELRRSSRSKR